MTFPLTASIMQPPLDEQSEILVSQKRHLLSVKCSVEVFAHSSFFLRPKIDCYSFSYKARTKATACAFALITFLRIPEKLQL